MKSAILAKVRRSIRKRFNRVFGRFLLIDRDSVGAAYLTGQGIEIGALHNPLKVPRSCRVRYVDNAPPTEAKRRFYDVLSRRLARVDILDDGERLSKIPDNSQDFVIANHFLEHCQNPIGAFRNMMRILKEGGILYAAIPDKRYTFDRDRPSTPFEHLLRDDRDGPESSRREHLAEWVRIIEGVGNDEAVNSRIEELTQMDFSVHYHVWDQAELFEFIGELRKVIRFELEMTLKRKNETIFVLRKGAPAPGATRRPTTSQVTGDLVEASHEQERNATRILGV